MMKVVVVRMLAGAASVIKCVKTASSSVIAFSARLLVYISTRQALFRGGREKLELARGSSSRQLRRAEMPVEV